MALEKKQQAFCDEYIIDFNATQAAIRRIEIIKLSALRKLCIHVGLIAPNKSLAIKDEEISNRLECYGDGVIGSCLAVMLNAETSELQKAAAALMFEVFVPNWKDLFPELAEIVVINRNDKLVSIWRKSVFKRDNYQCTECGTKEKLQAHHIDRWIDSPMLRVVVDNGVTLCSDCHKKAHNGNFRQ